MDEFQNLFDEDTLRKNIDFASLFVLNYECLKEYVVSQVREFYSDRISFVQGELICKESEKYKKAVRNLDKNIDIASLKWFLQAGAINEQELNLYHTCRKRRNDITHKLLKNLSLGFKDSDVELFGDMIQLYQKIDNWWINEIEIPTSADEIPEDYDKDQVLGGQAFILSAINDIILGNGAAKYNEILDLLRKMQEEKNYGQEYD